MPSKPTSHGPALRLWDATEAFAAPVSVLVNNAGIGVVRPLLELSDEDDQLVMPAVTSTSRLVQWPMCCRPSWNPRPPTSSATSQA